MMFAALLELSASLGIAAVGAAGGASQDFSDARAFGVEAIKHAEVVGLRTERTPGPTGKPSLSFDIKSQAENAGVILSWRFPPQVLDGEAFGVFLKVDRGPVNYVTVDFLGNNEEVWSATYFGVQTGGWRRVAFTVGEKGQANAATSRFIKGKKVDQIRLKLAGSVGRAFSAQVSDFGPLRSVRAPRREAPPSGKPTLESGATQLWLDEPQGYAFESAMVGGKLLNRSFGGIYPSFKFLNLKGQSVYVAADDPQVKVTRANRTEHSVAVRYTIMGTELEVTWSVMPDDILCDVTVLKEGELLTECVGEGALFEAALDAEDYGIHPDGYLLRPDASEQTWNSAVQGGGNQNRLNCGAVKEGNRIVLLKPLEFANEMILQTQRRGSADLAGLGTVLYYRPKGVTNPKTKRVHDRLSWRLESCGDVNGDGKTDWVDAAIFYRDKYIRPCLDANPLVRDSYHIWHQAPETDTFERLVNESAKLDFASGLYYVKGMVTSIGTMNLDRYPYRTKATSYNTKARLNARIAASGNRFGIWHAGGYIESSSGDFPDELVAVNAKGKPFKYFAWYSAADDIRGYATGKLQERFQILFDAAHLGPNDPAYLDSTGMCGLRFNYNPDYPGTPQTHLEVMRKWADWVRKERGVILASEGIVDGLQDMNDFGLRQCGIASGKAHSRFWESDFPQKIVPLSTVAFTGMTYCGDMYYELRRGTPNWTCFMLYCVGYWDWDSGHYPEHLYEKAARQFFNNNIFWSLIADRKIARYDRKGDEFTIVFEKGQDRVPAKIWGNPVKKAFWVEKDGIRYDGFTPFSTRGVMAITRQGDIDMVLPVQVDLEVLPSQPHRADLDVTISRTKDGFVRIKGNFSKIPWRLKRLRDLDGKEVTDEIEVEPVLMLRKVSSLRAKP